MNRVSWHLLLLPCIGAAVYWWMGSTTDDEHALPTLLAPALTEDCRQVLLVTVVDDTAAKGELRLLARESAADAWRQDGEAIPVTIGKKGLAWGAGEHGAIPKPDGLRVKQEGDKCSPAGVFRVPFAFGTHGAECIGWLRMPYRALTPTVIGVDDPASKYYNQIVDGAVVERDWDSNEAMIRHDELYEWGAFIAHNPEAAPGGGSCIFIHLWPDGGKPTSGCTAMSAENLRRVLGWMDPAMEPRLVQAVEGW